MNLCLRGISKCVSENIKEKRKKIVQPVNDKRRILRKCKMKRVGTLRTFMLLALNEIILIFFLLFLNLFRYLILDLYLLITEMEKVFGFHQARIYGFHQGKLSKVSLPIIKMSILKPQILINSHQPWIIATFRKYSWKAKKVLYLVTRVWIWFYNH